MNLDCKLDPFTDPDFPTENSSHCPVPQDGVGDPDDITVPLDVKPYPLGPFIQTHSGVHFHFQTASVDDIRLEDIAHSLSHICRYVGHAKRFYSVAEHSVHVMRFVQSMGLGKDYQRAALLHDADEAYVGDVAKPLKVLLGSVYADLEAYVEKLVMDRFNVHLPEAAWAVIKHADLVMLATEIPELMNHPQDTGGVHEALPPAWTGVGPIGWPAEQARGRFMWAARDLGLV